MSYISLVALFVFNLQSDFGSTVAQELQALETCTLYHHLSFVH